MESNTQINLPCMFVSGIYVGFDPQRDKGGQKARGSIHIATWFASLNETVIRSRFVCKEVLRGFDDNLKVIGDWDWTIFGVAAWQTADGIPQTSRSLVQHVFVASCLLNVLLQDLALLLKAGRVRRWKDWTERKVEKRYMFFWGEWFQGAMLAFLGSLLQDVAWTCCNQSHMTSELQTHLPRSFPAPRLVQMGIGGSLQMPLVGSFWMEMLMHNGCISWIIASSILHGFGWF